MTKLLSIADSLELEQQQRLEQQQDLLEYGIKYLDRAAGPIFKNDLILLGSKTGVGKTELAISIALHNAMKGKNINFFALEADYFEITRRMRYKLIANHFYSNPRPFALSQTKLNYNDWISGKYDGQLNEATEKAHEELKKIKNLFVLYKMEDFSIKDLTKFLIDEKDEADMTIIDHLHYIDYDGENENKELSEITKTIRNLSIALLHPIICLAHVRKTVGGKMNAPIVPDLEDFHGSSNLVKIATKAIMLGKTGEKVPNESCKYYSYVRVAKNRKAGDRTHFVARLIFDVSKNSYEDKFVLGTLKNNDKEFEPISEGKNLPSWLGDL